MDRHCLHESNMHPPANLQPEAKPALLGPKTRRHSATSSKGVCTPNHHRYILALPAPAPITSLALENRVGAGGSKPAHSIKPYVWNSCLHRKTAGRAGHPGRVAPPGVSWL